MRDDEGFLAHVTRWLAGLPCVWAVALGGSRATGSAEPAVNRSSTASCRVRSSPTRGAP